MLRKQDLHTNKKTELKKIATGRDCSHMFDYYHIIFMYVSNGSAE